MLRDARAFSEICGDWLAANPFTTSVLGSTLAAVLAGAREPGVDTVWIAVLEEDRAVGAAMHTPPYPPFLPGLPRGTATHIVRALLNEGRQFSGVSGEAATVEEFASAWTSQTGGTATPGMAMRMYRLGVLAAPTQVPGRARTATTSDADLVSDWFGRFQAEAMPGSPHEHPAAAASRPLAAGHVWLWECQGHVVSLAAGTSANGVARIGPVYTPPEHRSRGYGAAITAHATQAFLDTGAADIVLNTDLANPTANAIYQQIGYRPHHDAREYHLHG